MIPIILFTLALAATLFHRKMKGPPFTETLLSYVLFFNVGVMGLLGFLAHTYFADDTANMIGWPTGSPFQLEIASANFAFGVLGLLSFFIRGNFWLATIIGFSLFLLGDLIVHLYHYFALGNTSYLNIGLPIWLEDLVLPILLTYLYKASNSR